MTTNTITFAGGDSFTTTAEGRFYNTSRELVRVGCATRVGERFK